MTRRRIILAAVALLLAAIVMAVQRDTFVRRWCLPTPPPATRAAGPLDQVIDEFEIDDARLLEKVRELERRSAARARFTAFDSMDWLPGEPQRRTVRGATVEQLLCRIFCSNLYALDDPFTIDADGFVILGERNGRISPTTARVHVPDRALIPPHVRPTDRWRVWGSPANLIPYLRPCTVHRIGTRALKYDPILRFGAKLIVVTTPRNHWLIDQILREEADAQQAKLAQPAATLPAR